MYLTRQHDGGRQHGLKKKNDESVDKLSVTIQTQQKETRGCLVDVFSG